MVDQYIKIWCDRLEAWEPMTDEEVGQLVRAMIRYRQTGAVPILSGAPAYVWPRERLDLDRAAESYDRRCEKNKKNGAKGGRPQKSSVKPQNPLGFSETQEEEEKEDYHSPPVSPSKPENSKAPKAKFATYVTMTDAEHQALFDTYGPADTARLIEILDNYKGSIGKTYNSDYHAILSWCVDKLGEEKASGRKRPVGAFASTYAPDDVQSDMDRMCRYAAKLRDGV